MTKLRIGPLLAAVCVGLAVMGTAIAETAAQQNRLVRVSYSTGWDALPVIVGIERGFFAGANLIVSGVPASDAGAVAQSLDAGTTDVAILPQRAFLSLIANDVAIKAIAVNTYGSQLQLVAPAGSAVQEVADLRGQTVGFSRGTGAVGVFMRLMNQAGLGKNDIALVELGAADIVTALQNGQVDAIFDFAHLTVPLVEAQRAEIVMSAPDVRDALGLIAAMPLVASPRFLANEPDAARALVAAWTGAQAYIHANPDDSARLLRIFLHRHGVVTTEELASKWIGLQRYDQPVWSNNAIKDAEYNAWGLNALGLLPKIPDVAASVDNGFVPSNLRVSN